MPLKRQIKKRKQERSMLHSTLEKRRGEMRMQKEVRKKMRNLLNWKGKDSKRKDTANPKCS
jgi:hypothetical protein